MTSFFLISFIGRVILKRIYNINWIVGEGDNRGWDGWMASLTRWTWVWMNSGSWWWTGRPGVLRFMGTQRVRHDWATELNWTELNWMNCYGLPSGSVVKNPPANAGDTGLIPGLGRSPGGGNGNPLQYSCLENTMDRGAWQAIVLVVAKSQTWVSDWTHTQWTVLKATVMEPPSKLRTRILWTWKILCLVKCQTEKNKYSTSSLICGVLKINE